MRIRLLHLFKLLHFTPWWWSCVETCRCLKNKCAIDDIYPGCTNPSCLVAKFCRRCLIFFNMVVAVLPLHTKMWIRSHAPNRMSQMTVRFRGHLILWVLIVELVSCHTSGSYNSEAASRFMESFRPPNMYYVCRDGFCTTQYVHVLSSGELRPLKLTPPFPVRGGH
jgi:hypothetical protein